MLDARQIASEEYFRHYHNAARDLLAKSHQYTHMREALFYPKGTALDDMPKGKGGEVKTFADRLATLDAFFDNEVIKAARDYENETLVFEDVLASIENGMQREVMRRRYGLGQNWAEVAREMFVSERSVYNLHDRALTAAFPAIPEYWARMAGED